MHDFVSVPPPPPPSPLNPNFNSFYTFFVKSYHSQHEKRLKPLSPTLTPPATFPRGLQQLRCHFLSSFSFKALASASVLPSSSRFLIFRMPALLAATVGSFSCSSCLPPSTLSATAPVLYVMMVNCPSDGRLQSGDRPSFAQAGFLQGAGSSPQLQQAFSGPPESPSS